jgi:hypothetical protein
LGRTAPTIRARSCQGNGARTRSRFTDGKARRIEKFGTSRAKATFALKYALTTIEAAQGGELKPTTSLRVLAQMFLDAKRDVGRSAGTLETYGYAVSAHIIPKLGDLTVAEAKPERLQPFLNRVDKENGPGAAKNCRSTLSGMMSLAVVNGAIETNPVRELERISRTQGKKRGSSTIPLDDLPTLFTHVVRMRT